MSETDDNIEEIPTDTETTFVDSELADQLGHGADVERFLRAFDQRYRQDGEYGEGDWKYEAYAGEFGEEEGEESSDVDPAHYISGPRLSPDCTMSEFILEFDYSYGYSCRKLFNLTVLQEDVVVFASGNYIHFLNITTKEIWFKRSALGGGIGHIRKNPNPEYPYFAVAECGKRPLIIMYEWPAMDIICTLKGGATRTYANMDFSPDGHLLLSQAGEPDYLITIWNWKRHRILLRTKSNVNDVYRVIFSPFVPGQLASCGVAHIKFWKMAQTFTGLKLKGELGRFGKTEYSDIYGIFPMPDEKVLSGSSWGNILVWDEGLIHLEIFRTQRRTCHSGPIMQFYFYEGELYTVSLDGHIKIWWYENVDQADPSDDDRVVLLDPSCDFYTPGTMLYCIEKQIPDDHKHTWWYAQDGNGGIWLMDLNSDENPQPSVLLYKCHGGEVVDMVACPYANYLISLGKDGRIFFYNYITKRLIHSHELPAKGASLLWPTLQMIPTGDVIIAGFDDGQVRVIDVNIEEEDVISTATVQIYKPHHKPITKIEMNLYGSILVTGGEDSTIFIFKVSKWQNPSNLLTPIGFLPTPDSVSFLTWNPFKENTILVCCIHGQMMEVEVPEHTQQYTEKSYLLHLEPKYKNFTSYKSQIRRDIVLREIEQRKIQKLENKKMQMEEEIKKNPGIEIDEEAYLVISDTEEELEPLYIPEVPNPILWARYTEEGTIWLSMGGYDAGYIYEYLMDQKEEPPYKFQMIDDADDTEISSYLYNETMEYLFFAMQDGSIRINKVNQDDWHDMKNYWILSMHDNQDGFVPKMCLSFNERYFFSCGHDGNVFAYRFLPQGYVFKESAPRSDHLRRSATLSRLKDVSGYEKLSLEQVMTKAESDRIQRLANEHKARVREMVKGLKERYSKILQRNQQLLPSQIIPRSELELDQRVMDHVDRELNNKLELVKRKLAYNVEKSRVQMEKLQKYITIPCDMHPLTVTGLKDPNLAVMTVRQRVLSSMFYPTRELVLQKIEEDKARGRGVERVPPASKAAAAKLQKSAALEYFLLSLSPSTIEKKMGPKINRMLDKYRQRRNKWEKRAEQWEEFMAKKPTPGKNHPDDEKLLDLATNTMGDYKLKESHDYKAPPELRDTTMKKYLELLNTRMKQFNLRHTFISKVWELRDLKYKIRQFLLERLDVLKKIQEEFPPSMNKKWPVIPDINEKEFPEHNLTPNIILPEEEEEPAITTSKDMFVQPLSKEQEIRDLFVNIRTFPQVEDGFFQITASKDEIIKFLEMDFDALTDSTPITVLEMNFRAKRLNRELFNQQLVIQSMEEEVEYFDDLLEQTKKLRLPNLFSGNFVDIYISTLNLELNILKKFEEGEDRLMEKVTSNLNLVHNLQDIIDEHNNTKDNIQLQIENLIVEENKLQEKFKHATESNKFYDFLRKVFKKKYKPPKIKTDDDDSSESSSSSSSESDDADDSASIDSRDFGFIKQDLNVCPKGCELSIYNLTVELRTKRHGLEQEVKEQQRLLDLVKKEIDMGMRKMNGLKNQLNISENELEAFLREKQRRLNEVMCTVVLKLDQIYDFNPETSDIKDFLVFSKTGLSNLYARVGELEKEDFEQKSKYDTYLQHLTRMKKDIRYMRQKITNLKNHISELMLTKFGKKVNLSELELVMLQKTFHKSCINELEEVVLKKLVYQLRVRMSDIKSIYLKELNAWNAKIAQAQEELFKVLRENTKKLELLQVINKEKNDLMKVVLSQPRKIEYLSKAEQVQYEDLQDVAKLDGIMEDQYKYMEQLRREIKMLKTKGLCPTPMGTETPDTGIKKEEISKVWDLEKYLEEEEDFYKGWEEEGEVDKTGEQIEIYFKKDITIPGFYSTESEDVIQELLEELMEGVNTEKMVKEILSSIMRCTSVTDILHEIVNHLPIVLSDVQRSSVELASEKLYLIQEPNITDESFQLCAKELLEDVVDAVMAQSAHAEEALVKVVESLVESIPVDYLLKEESLEVVEKKVRLSLTESQTISLDREALMNNVSGTISENQKEEVTEILNIIIDRIFGTEE